MIPTIFELLRHMDAGRDHVLGEAGSGLCLARSLAELHGGSITASSEGTGKGSELVGLPELGEVLAPTRLLSTRPAREPGPNKPDCRRILVVDDNVDAARSLAKVLTLLHGQEVQVGHDGPSALEIAETFRPQIVLLDIGLPGMNGHEVAVRLRLRPWFEGCLLVAVTGWGQEKDRAKSFAAGFDHHLVKPVNRETIQHLLEGTLQPPR